MIKILLILCLLVAPAFGKSKDATMTEVEKQQFKDFMKAKGMKQADADDIINKHGDKTNKEFADELKLILRDIKVKK